MSDEDCDAIAEFIRSKGITRCPTADTIWSCHSPISRRTSPPISFTGDSLCTPTTAVIAVDSSNFGASYTALTIFTNSQGTSFLYAANNADGGGIDMFNGDFTFLQTFSDPQIPQKFAIRNLGHK